MIVEQINPLYVCGIVGDETSLIVIKNLTGRFTNRYDLATAPLTVDQTLSATVSQITAIQTGLQTAIAKQLGTIRFTFPALTADQPREAMINTFYLLEPVGGKLLTNRPAFTAAVSDGAARVPLDQLNWSNSSPLVMQAKRYLKTGAFPVADQEIAVYDVPTTPQFPMTTAVDNSNQAL
ncbi:phosphohydrolase [Lactiplantibacillus mudanjiangensis]|uniref:Phosphohydrolase [Lactobacillus sp.] n=1 Tax=Lactiplantibacillus mudanjiangensis TaxID=1296538 RepID=A0A660DWT9_9LACO|nr:phosphohydrolase [Lactiplantibacillus mudanjiangensis]VDG18843.1 phosphohydrolase [Lactobacillus sp.] [Lactiplantibacillus mudanjiangensis]VDG25378.1 phosphohydrolase [Lactobacillus sp.] [Lactiplantibacillus mudanjiangensis]VDG27591.1 phosphohydrolase [Lactobacillus sp.] [Lactiplantibacillus mudanjiangensis]VDG32941.1 phosphohydrolase [Lactobacillus sp.] [Lactiplantibacillus mudanjiangensis]